MEKIAIFSSFTFSLLGQSAWWVCCWNFCFRHILIYPIKEGKIYFFDWLIFIFCLIATFCNPYTYHIWWEVWVSLADGSLRWSIQEWLPAFFVANYDLFFLIPFSLIFIVFTRKH